MLVCCAVKNPRIRTDMLTHFALGIFWTLWFFGFLLGSKLVAQSNTARRPLCLAAFGTACLLDDMVRPERFELPTFWFVAVKVAT